MMWLVDLKGEKNICYITLSCAQVGSSFVYKSKVLPPFRMSTHSLWTIILKIIIIGWLR
jgi:hypothetical protein